MPLSVKVIGQSSLFGVLVILSLCSSAEAASDPCHMRELDLCAADAAGGKKVPSNDAEVESHCNLAKGTKNCTDDYIAKCATPLQKELLQFVSEGPKQTADDFCSKDSTIRKNYLKHASCLAKAQGKEKECTSDMQAALEKLEQAKHQDRVATACCAHVRHQKCSESIIESMCGKEAIEYGQLILRMVSGDLPNVMCQGFDANPQCSSLLPAPGTAPKGNNKSMIGKIMKAYFKV